MSLHKSRTANRKASGLSLRGKLSALGALLLITSMAAFA